MTFFDVINLMTLLDLNQFDLFIKLNMIIKI